MSKLSRAVIFVVSIWLLALGLAVPQAIQFGIIYDYHNGTARQDNTARCSVKEVLIGHAFEISTMLFFVFPMTVITVLYILIAIMLRRSRLLTATVNWNHLPAASNHCDSGRSESAAQRNIIRMLNEWKKRSFALNFKHIACVYNIFYISCKFIFWLTKFVFASQRGQLKGSCPSYCHFNPLPYNFSNYCT